MSQREYHRALRQRRKELGLVHVQIWLPKEDQPELERLVSRSLRRKFNELSEKERSDLPVPRFVFKES